MNTNPIRFRLRQLLVEMLWLMKIAKTDGILELDECIEPGTNEAVKMMIIYLTNGIDPMLLKELMVDHFTYHSELEREEAAMIRLFAYYIQHGDNSSRVAGLMNRIFRLDLDLMEMAQINHEVDKMYEAFRFILFMKEYGRPWYLRLLIHWAEDALQRVARRC